MYEVPIPHACALSQRLFEQLPGRFAVPVATTTRPAGPSDIDDRSDMECVTRDQAEAMLTASPGAFLVHEAVLDHIYGITYEAVKRVQSSGKVCVIELDHVADAQRLRDEGFDANYIFIGVNNMDELFRCCLMNSALGRIGSHNIRYGPLHELHTL